MLNLHDLLLEEAAADHIEDEAVLRAIVLQALYEVPPFMARSWLAEQFDWYLARKRWEHDRDQALAAAQATPEARLKAIVEEERADEMLRYLQGG